MSSSSSLSTDFFAGAFFVPVALDLGGDTASKSDSSSLFTTFLAGAFFAGALDLGFMAAILLGETTGFLVSPAFLLSKNSFKDTCVLVFFVGFMDISSSSEFSSVAGLKCMKLTHHEN